ncbi:MAG: hypothetical protein ACREVO_16205 [Steroidobacteraceae bacterium]
MQAGRLAYVSLIWIMALRAGPALAQQAGHGVLEVDYIADRREAGAAAGDGYGYEVTAGYAPTGSVVVFGEYEHLLNALRPRLLGWQEENDYEPGVKLTYSVTPEVQWVTALGYEVADVEAAAVASAERGYDLVQGLRIMPTPRLELIADLHYETVGPATTAVVLGFVQRFASRFAFEGVLEHSRSEGRYDNNYRVGFRFYP